MRFSLPALALVILAGPVAAGDEGLTGYWKFNLAERNSTTTLWLLHIDSKDGKLTVTADPLRGAPKVKVEDAKLVGDSFQLKFRATIGGAGGPQEIVFDFEGKLPKAGAKKILGSFSEGASALPVILEATSAKNIFELDRDTVTRTPSDPRALVAIFDLIDRAKENKVAAKELQEWIDGTMKGADFYGPRYQAQFQLRLLEALRPQKTYTAVAVEVAKRAGKQIDPKASVETQLSMLSTVAEVLRLADQRDAALETRLEKLEGQAYAAYMKDALDFKTPKFAGRKGKSNRAVLVELFTGAQCPPCVAADMAFDGIEKSYAGTEVVLLQYHMHIPRPDPMTNADTEARFDYYKDGYPTKVRGTPTGIFNGTPGGSVGGFKDDAEERYKMFRDIVNKLMETPATVQLSAIAVRKGENIAITAKVDDLEKPGDKIRLRLVLVEDWVRYKGSNQLAYHHRVVRAMPGGARGFTLKKKSSEHSADVNLDELRKNLNRYLDDEYTEGARPMRLRDLHVVAFVQNDETTDVLHAIDVRVKDGK
jgi:hypothetical protein